MARPFFTRERISDFEIYERNCDLSLGHAKNRLAEGHPIDFQVCNLFLQFGTELLSHTTPCTGPCIPLHIGLRYRVPLRHQRRFPCRRDSIFTAFRET